LISSILFVGSFITAFKSSKLKEENIRKEAFINTSLSVFILGLVIMILTFFLVTLRIR
jgi:heme/copper-type cytochrome/quinol oxidase subunit 2